MFAIGSGVIARRRERPRKVVDSIEIAFGIVLVLTAVDARRALEEAKRLPSELNLCTEAIRYRFADLRPMTVPRERVRRWGLVARSDAAS